jgi:hypothetical protein
MANRRKQCMRALVAGRPASEPAAVSSDAASRATPRRVGASEAVVGLLPTAGVWWAKSATAGALWEAGSALNEQMGLPLANLRPLLLRGHQLASQGSADSAAEIYARARALAESRSLDGMIEFVDAARAGVQTARA